MIEIQFGRQRILLRKDREEITETQQKPPLNLAINNLLGHLFTSSTTKHCRNSHFHTSITSDCKMFSRQCLSYRYFTPLLLSITLLLQTVHSRAFDIGKFTPSPPIMIYINCLSRHNKTSSIVSYKLTFNYSDFLLKVAINQASQSQYYFN